MKLAEYLERVWEVVAHAALKQVLGVAGVDGYDTTAGALEEDARLTALFLCTLQNTDDGDGVASNDEALSAADAHEGITGPRRRENGYTMPFDVARQFAQPLGIHLDEQASRNIIDIDKGIVRLTTIYFGPQHQGAYPAYRQVRRRILRITRRHSAPLLQLAETILHQMARLIQRHIILPRHLPIALRRYHRCHPARPRRRQYRIGVIAPIRQQMLRFNSVQQRLRPGAIGRRSRHSQQPNRHSVGVHRQVEFSSQSLLARPTDPVPC